MFKFWYRYRVRREMRRQAAAQRATSLRRKTSWWKAPFVWLHRQFTGFVRSLSRSLATWIDYLSKQKRNWRDLLIALPAVGLLIGFVSATAMGHVRQRESGLKYWRAGEGALAQQNPEDALIYFQKAMMAENVNQNDLMFGLARAYEATNQKDRADVLMATLAGVGVNGLPQAHRYLAIRTAEKVAATQTIDDLEAWHWHLTHADQSRSAPLQKSWGMYYLIGGDLENAINHYKIAADEEPAMWLQVAELYARQNDMDAVRTTLATARQRLEQQFLRDPGKAENRLLYATSLFYIGQLPDAERLLKEGLDKGDNSDFRKLLAAVFIRMYDVELASERGIESAFKFLKLALDYDQNFTPALSRLVAFARSSPERLEESREAIRQLIATGNSSAMAHFTLGTIEWMAGNNQLALLNMQQAIQLDPKMPIIANNVAYLMAQEENPDLDAALNLVNQAVESDPANSEFRDTRGDIFLQRGELAKSAADFQAALETARNPVPLQEKLAKLYDQLGDVAMASKFREAASKAQSAASPERSP